MSLPTRPFDEAQTIREREIYWKIERSVLRWIRVRGVQGTL